MIVNNLKITECHEEFHVYANNHLYTVVFRAQMKVEVYSARDNGKWAVSMSFYREYKERVDAYIRKIISSPFNNEVRWMWDDRADVYWFVDPADAMVVKLGCG